MRTFLALAAVLCIAFGSSGCSCGVDANAGLHSVPSSDGRAVESGARAGFQVGGQAGPGAKPCPPGGCTVPGAQ
jgi:hypothetical protein